MRTIKVVQPATASVKRFETSVTTWGEFVTEIQSEYDFSKVKATIKETKVSLEHPDAALPEGDFTIFLRASKNKAGVDFSTLSYKELKEYIKNDPEAKKYLASFITDGRNWTQFKTPELIAGLTSYQDSIRDGSNSVEVEEVEEEVTENHEETTSVRVTEEIEETSAEEIQENVVEHPDAPKIDIYLLSTQEKFNLASNLIDIINCDIEDAPNFNAQQQSDLQYSMESVHDHLSSIQKIIFDLNRSEEEIAAEIEALRRLREEDEYLLREAIEIESDFN